MIQSLVELRTENELKPFCSLLFELTYPPSAFYGDRWIRSTYGHHEGGAVPSRV
jgi:hypothetical protein